MQMSKSGVSFLWAGDQKKKAHPVLGLDDLIRLLPSCLLQVWPERGLPVLPGRHCRGQCLRFLSTTECSSQTLHVTLVCVYGRGQ